MSVMGNIFEVTMMTQLFDYIELHHLLVPAQFDFRTNKSSTLSTVLAVETLVEFIL